MKIKYLVLLLMAFVVISCGDDDKPNNPSKPQVLSFSPDRGSVGTPVTINGSNFPTNISGIVVKFNGTNAVIDSAKSNAIYVRVPAGATSGKVVVTISSVDYTAPGEFMIVSSSGSLLPITMNNYWVYNKFQLDTNNNVINSNPGRDSLFAAGTIIKLGKESNYLTSFSKMDASSAYERGTDQFYYEVGSILYAHSSWFDDLMNFGGGGIPLPFDIEEQWLKLVDPNSTQWEIYTRQFLNEPLSFGTLTGTLTLVGVNEGIANVLVSNRTYSDARQINFRFRFVGNANTQFGTLPLNLERVLTVWYAPSIGRVKSKMNTMKFKIEGLVDQFIPGFELQLIDSKLN